MWSCLSAASIVFAPPTILVLSVIVLNIGMTFTKLEPLKQAIEHEKEAEKIVQFLKNNPPGQSLYICEEEWASKQKTTGKASSSDPYIDDDLYMYHMTQSNLSRSTHSNISYSTYRAPNHSSTHSGSSHSTCDSSDNTSDSSSSSSYDQ
jgi:hypothetical protein